MPSLDIKWLPCKRAGHTLESPFLWDCKHPGVCLSPTDEPGGAECLWKMSSSCGRKWKTGAEAWPLHAQKPEFWITVLEDFKRERETEKERDLSIQLQPDKMLSTLNSCLGEITTPEKLKVSVTQPVNTRAGFTWLWSPHSFSHHSKPVFRKWKLNLEAKTTVCHIEHPYSDWGVLFVQHFAAFYQYVPDTKQVVTDLKTNETIKKKKINETKSVRRGRVDGRMDRWAKDEQDIVNTSQSSWHIQHPTTSTLTTTLPCVWPQLLGHNQLGEQPSAGFIPASHTFPLTWPKSRRAMQTRSAGGPRAKSEPATAKHKDVWYLTFYLETNSCPFCILFHKIFTMIFTWIFKNHLIFF